jgi:hypothetical protein
MSYLEISGITIPVASAKESRADLKTELRTIDGTWMRDVRAAKRRWTLMTRLMPLDEARALRDLVMGMGHHWGFDGGSQYSDKGAGAWVGSYTVPDTGGKFGGGRLSVSGSGRTLTLGAAYGELWTIAQWIFDPDEGDWVHRLQTSDGRKYTGGVATPSASWSQTLTSGGVYTVPYDGLSGVGGCDDLVILPFELPASWCVQWPQDQPFSPLPRLSITGEMIEQASLLVEGSGDPELVTEQGVIDGVYQRLATVSFELEQV